MNIFAASIRSEQATDTLAVMDTLPIVVRVIIALIFVKPRQCVVRLKKT